MVAKKLLVWGTGRDSINMMRRNPFINIFVDSIIDSYKSESSFFDRPIISPNEVKWDEPVFIIIATRKYYDEISVYLNGRGLIHGRDYIGVLETWYQWLISFEDDDFIKRILLLREEIKILSKWLPNIVSKLILKCDIIKKYAYTGSMDAKDAIIQSCADINNKVIELRDNVLFEYDNIKDFAIIFKELLLSEDYYFATEKEVPLIIDAGANVGLAIFYFKSLYPKARIIAFEPMPSLYGIVKRNIEKNQWTDVTVYPFALSDVNRECTFYIQKSGLAGSLGKRNQEGVNPEEILEIKVQCVCLSDYMEESVDYLKMDVEGSETVVIEEIEHQLKKVNYIFVEFHEGQLKGNNSIAQIASILEKHGFDINISKSAGSLKSSASKPMQYVGSRVSEVIWARRK